MRAQFVEFRRQRNEPLQLLAVGFVSLFSIEKQHDGTASNLVVQADDRLEVVRQEEVGSPVAAREGRSFLDSFGAHDLNP
jgi:hypothetical protein